MLIAFQALLASKALLHRFLGYIQGANGHGTCNLLHHTLQAELGGIAPLFELMAQLALLLQRFRLQPIRTKLVLEILHLGWRGFYWGK